MRTSTVDTAELGYARVGDIPAQLDARTTRRAHRVVDRSWAWRSGPCAAVAHRFEVACEPPGIEHHLDLVTRPLRVHAAHRDVHQYRIIGHEQGPPYDLYVDDTLIRSAPTPQALVRFLVWHVNRRMVEATSRTHVVFHAAAAVRAGITVLLPGDQERGKTTTVAGLLREGYDYLTDEAAAVDPATLSVAAFPKALSMDPGSWPLFSRVSLPVEVEPTGSRVGRSQRHVPAERLGGRPLTRPARPPRLIVFPEYVAGSTTGLVELDGSQAVRDLALASFDFHEHAARNLRVAAALVAGATAVRLRIGRLDEAVDLIEACVSQVLLREL